MIYLIVNILMHQAAQACRREVTDLSFRKSAHFISLWIRQWVGRSEPVNHNQMDQLLLDLVIYAPAETRQMKKRKAG